MINFYREYGNVFCINVPKRFFNSSIDLINNITESGYKDYVILMENEKEYLLICYDTFHKRCFDLKDYLGGKHCSKLDTFTAGFFLEYLKSLYKDRFLVYEKGEY